MAGPPLWQGDGPSKAGACFSHDTQLGQAHGYRPASPTEVGFGGRFGWYRYCFFLTTSAGVIVSLSRNFLRECRLSIVVSTGSRLDLRSGTNPMWRPNHNPSRPSARSTT